MMFLAELKVFSIAIDLVSHHGFRIKPIFLIVVFYGLDQGGSFVKGIKAYTFHVAKPINDTDRQFGSKLHISPGLTTNDGSDKRHVQAHDAVLYRMLPFLIHLKLLPIDFLAHQYPGEDSAVVDQSLCGLSGSCMFLFIHIQIIFTGVVTIGSWFLCASNMGLMQSIDDFFYGFPSCV